MSPRIVGVETEYGLAAHQRGRGRLSSSEAAHWLFLPIEREARTSNVFLRNGGRLYLDIGAHPEYATPECLTADDLVLAERAGDEIMTRLITRAEQAAAAEGRPMTFRLFKNNVDSHRNSYGSHENYSLARSVDLELLAERLTPFLITRQILCGAGRWHPDGFRISQRAEHLHDGLSALTTRARPLINTRDEPLADPARFRRLHVLAGDSNLSEASAWLKVASTMAVLDLIETIPPGVGHPVDDFALADPGRALREVSLDPEAPVELASGRRISAIQHQRAYLNLLEATAGEPTDRWGAVLDALEAGDWDHLEPMVEWVTKRALLTRYRDRHDLPDADPRLAQLDLAFHDLAAPNGRPHGLFRILEAAGAVARRTEPGAVERATNDPPADTRAALRGRLIAAAQQRARSYTADWMAFTVHDLPDASGEPTETQLVCPDPFAAADAAADDLIGRMLTEPRARTLGGFVPPAPV